MGGCIDNYSHFFYWQGPNRHDLWRNGEEIWRDGEFFGDLMVSQCKQFITENNDRPFFLYWAINMPHYPLQGTEKWRKIYRDMEAPRRMYATFVSTADAMIGQVMGHLEMSGLRDDTIVIFLSDHGHSVEQRTFGGGGSAGPYRGHKFTLWEGGIRVPCIVCWPGHIPERAVRNQVATSMDWFPTLAHYCNVQPPGHKIDGKNIAPVIESARARSPHKVLHWESGKHWAVRDGDWKLVFNGPGTQHKGRKIPKEQVFLSNLAKDVTETQNLAKEHPDVVKRLTKLHSEWLKEVGQK
jgi:arylsulfatase A-like enzyme